MRRSVRGHSSTAYPGVNESRLPSEFPRPLGRNKGGYFGERIEIDEVLSELRAAAVERGWLAECFFTSAAIKLLAFRREVSSPRKRLYVSSGIHGDEPAGPLAVLALVKENQWPGDAEMLLCPCLNPIGFARNTRENENHIDLNRDYRNSRTPEIRAHIEWLKRHSGFDRSIILHEDWEAKGFYVYELNPKGEPSNADRIIRRVSQVCPIETAARIDNWDASNGVIRPKVDPSERRQWPEAIFLISSGARTSYTLEAPSDFPLTVRVNALLTGVKAALE